MSPPCTILLRINGGFERISDATVIENGDHLHYEKPVGSVIVLEETTHKVLYIMNKEDICSSDLLTDESYSSKPISYCNGEVNLSDVTSQQALCTNTQANCTNDKNDCEQQPKLKIENCTLQNKRNNGLIDYAHAIHSKNECPNSIEKLTLEDESNSLNFCENIRNSSVFDNKSVFKRTNEKTDIGKDDSNNDRPFQVNNHSSHSSRNEEHSLSNNPKKRNSISHEGTNQVGNQLSLMTAEVHTNKDRKESEEIYNEDKTTQQMRSINREPHFDDKKSGHDNKTIIDNQSRIESNERALKASNNSCANFSSNPNSDYQNNEKIQGTVNNCFEERSIKVADSNEITKFGKLKMPSTMSMASLTSSLDLGSNWTRPLRRRSTLSTIISTTSCATNTANASATLNKLQSGNDLSSSLFHKCRLSSNNTNPANLVGSGEDCIDKLRPDTARSNEMEVKEGRQDKIQFRAHKGAPSELDIEEKILQRREMAHLFKWYYPEGGWGWVVLCAAMFSQAICHGGLQMGFSYPLGVIIRKSFGAIQQQSQREEILYSIDNDVTAFNELIEASDNEAFLPGNKTRTSAKGVNTSSDDHLSQLQIGKKYSISITSYYFYYPVCSTTKIQSSEFVPNYE